MKKLNFETFYYFSDYETIISYGVLCGDLFGDVERGLESDVERGLEFELN
jgi:hypothetical protein